MSVLAHSLIHSFAHSFIHWSINQASKRARNQPTNQSTHSETTWDTPHFGSSFSHRSYARQNSEENEECPLSGHSSTAVFQIFTKTQPRRTSCCFFQLIEAIYQLQTLEEQEAHLLFNITSPGVPRLHIDDFKNALFRKDFWIFWCFWKRAFLKRTLVSSLFFPSLDDFGNVFVWLCLKTTSVLTSSRSQCPPMTPRTSVGTIDLKILSERSHPRDLIGGF